MSNPRALFVFLVVSGLAWALYFVLPDYFGSIFLLCGIHILLAVSLNLVNGITGQFSLGHAGFMAIGAYTSAFLAGGPLAATFKDPVTVHLGMALCVVASAAMAAFAGYIVGLPSLRLKGDYLAIVTLGFGEIIRVGILNAPFLGGATGFTAIPTAGGPLWIFGLCAIACLACYRIMDSSEGRALLSVREDEIAAAALGINTTKYKVRAFVASAAGAGVAGALYAHQQGYINPSSFGFMKSVEIVVMVVLGGMGSMSGAVVAAVLLTMMPEALRPLKELTGTDLRMVIYSLVLVFLMLYRPQGLLGRFEVWEWVKKYRQRHASNLTRTSSSSSAAASSPSPKGEGREGEGSDE